MLILVRVHHERIWVIVQIIWVLLVVLRVPEVLLLHHLHSLLLLEHHHLLVLVRIHLLHLHHLLLVVKHTAGVKWWLESALIHVRCRVAPDIISLILRCMKKIRWLNDLFLSLCCWLTLSETWRRNVKQTRCWIIPQSILLWLVGLWLLLLLHWLNWGKNLLLLLLRWLPAHLHASEHVWSLALRAKTRVMGWPCKLRLRRLLHRHAAKHILLLWLLLLHETKALRLLLSLRLNEPEADIVVLQVHALKHPSRLGRCLLHKSECICVVLGLHGWRWQQVHQRLLLLRSRLSWCCLRNWVDLSLSLWSRRQPHVLCLLLRNRLLLRYRGLLWQSCSFLCLLLGLSLSFLGLLALLLGVVAVTAVVRVTWFAVLVLLCFFFFLVVSYCLGPGCCALSFGVWVISTANSELLLVVEPELSDVLAAKTSILLVGIRSACWTSRSNRVRCVYNVTLTGYSLELLARLLCKFTLILQLARFVEELTQSVDFISQLISLLDLVRILVWKIFERTDFVQIVLNVLNAPWCSVFDKVVHHMNGFGDSLPLLWLEL